MSTTSDEDNIGFGNPPKKSQFKKGQSGNPSGRPKGTRNFGTHLDEVLNTPITITKMVER